jgi:membrane protein YqaA with SNARE-associated domain
VIKAWVTTMLVATVSAFLPAVPIEPYLLGAVAATGHSGLLLGIAAGVGQTVGKVLIFSGTRGTLRSAALRRWIDRHAARFRDKAPAGAPDGPVSGGPAGEGPVSGGRAGEGPVSGGPVPVSPRRRRRTVGPTLKRWQEALMAALRHPTLAVPVLLLSAVTGVPPLLLVVFYAAGTKMPAGLFAAVCLVGRSARFIAIASVPHLAGIG